MEDTNYENGAGAHQNANPHPPFYGSMPIVQNHLAMSIIITLFCCMPLGIIALVYATQVNLLLAMGNVNLAMETSKKAKFWCFLALGIGVTFALLYVLLYAVIFAFHFAKTGADIGL